MIPAVALSGAGCLCAAGATLDEAVDSLMAGRRDPRPPLRFTTAHVPPFPVFERRDFQEPAHLTRSGALALAAAEQALADAGLDRAALAGLRVGVLMGTTVGCALSEEDTCRAYRKGETFDPAALRRIAGSQPARLIASTFGLQGPCQAVVNACSSGTDALGIGAMWIREGLCDLVLAGGCDELSRTTLNGFASMKILDTDPCRPFDRDRKGLNLGEGAAVLVLESEASLARRGRTPRARVAGFGSACDAHHPTAPHPGGAGLRSALERALREAGIAPAELAFVNAHGTGTPDNDRVESRALGDLLPGVPYVSTKGFTGHTLGAAGAIEAAFTVACLERGELPGSIGFATPDPDLGPPPVAVRTPVRGGAAISTSLAFGGNNAAVLITREERP